MVTTSSKKLKCSVCGHLSEQRYIVDSSVEGNSDLDLRTAEPHRSSMEYWTMTCPECGYCCENIEEPFENSEFLKSEKYLGLDGINADSKTGADFIKKALIKIESGKIEDALQSYVYAAWAFDDSGETENAVECRNRAISLINEYLKTKSNINYQVLKCDLLRRAGRFEEVIAEYSEKVYLNPLIKRLIKFEILKASEKDDKIYKTSDIPNDII